MAAGLRLAQVQQVTIRAIDQQEAKPIPEAAGGAPFFSPDGKWLVFYHASYRKHPENCPQRRGACRSRTTSGIAGGHWGEDGKIVWGFFDLLSVPAAGGPKEDHYSNQTSRAESDFSGSHGICPAGRPSCLPSAGRMRRASMMLKSRYCPSRPGKKRF